MQFESKIYKYKKIIILQGLFDKPMSVLVDLLKCSFEDDEILTMPYNRTNTIEIVKKHRFGAFIRLVHINEVYEQIDIKLLYDSYNYVAYYGDIPTFPQIIITGQYGQVIPENLKDKVVQLFIHQINLNF